MKEHSFFIFLGIEQDNTLKNKAKLLQENWQDFLQKNFKNISDYKIILDANDIQNLEPNKASIINEVKKHLAELKTFKKEVLGEIKTPGKWIGWLYPSFLEHTLLELEFFENGLKKEPSPQEILAFVNEHNSQEAGLTAHLLDPSQLDEVSKAHNFQMKFKELFKKMSEGEQKTFYDLSFQKTKELNEFALQSRPGILDKSVKSIINKTLIDHVIREGDRAEKILEYLVGKGVGQNKPSNTLF